MESKRKRLEDRDYAYTGREQNKFVRCCKCSCYTPFLFYQSSEAPDAQVKAAQYNLFCVNCMAEDYTKELNRAGNILYDKEVLKLFEGHEYQNPFYATYATQNRLIITGVSQINPKYEEIVRKPMPVNAKLRKIYKLFPPEHEMPFEKFSSISDMHTALHKKLKQIFRVYQNHLPSDSYQLRSGTSNDRCPLHQFGSCHCRSVMQPAHEKNRRQKSIPVNPTPQEAQTSRSSRVRLPRLAGG